MILLVLSLIFFFIDKINYLLLLQMFDAYQIQSVLRPLRALFHCDFSGDP